MLKNLNPKSYLSTFFMFSVYLVLINIYITSLGLMDDFNYTRMNFFRNTPTYFEFIRSDIESGGFRPFLPFQITLNNIGYYLFSVKGYFIFNLVYLFFILEFFYFMMSKFFYFDKFLYYLIIFSWPYSSDLIIHPSLQEKFIVLLICTFIYSYKNKKPLTSRLTILFIPLIKIQSLIFLPFITSVLKRDKNLKIYVSYFLFSSSLVLFVFFNKSESYFNSQLEFNTIINQIFTSPVNVVNIFLIITAFYIVKINDLVNKDAFYGLGLSNLFLIIFMSIYRNVGNYLNSINIFFIVIYILIIYDHLFKILNSKHLKKLVKFCQILIFTFVIISFTIPRFERMSSIGSVMNYSEENNIEIFYSCLEGVQYLNQFQNNNEFIYVNEFENIVGKEIKFLSDPFACNSIENVIIQNCKKTDTIDFKFENSMKIIEYQC